MDQVNLTNSVKARGNEHSGQVSRLDFYLHHHKINNDFFRPKKVSFETKKDEG